MNPLASGYQSRLRHIAEISLSIARTRLDLVAVETEVFVRGIVHDLLLGILAVLLAFLSLAFVGLWAVVAVTEPHRPWAIGAVILLYALGALASVVGIRRQRRQRGRWLHCTSEELRADLASLGGEGP